jgi:rhodanese-related sulfurtransferase
LISKVVSMTCRVNCTAEPENFGGKRELMEDMNSPFEVAPQTAKEQLTGGKQATLIDVREPVEFALARVEGAEFIPMGSIPAELEKLEGLSDSGDLLILCHHGVRSLQVTMWLRARGIENCYSVAGGIDRWSREVDESVAHY